MILDRNAFTAVDDTDYEIVDVPEAGEGKTVRVRSLTVDQRSRLYTRSDLDDKANAAPGSWRPLCCAMGMVDDKGAYLFPNEAAGAIELGKKHPELIERISAKIMSISVMTKASRSAAEKKSQEATTSSGSTSSPEQLIPATDSALTS